MFIREFLINLAARFALVVATFGFTLLGARRFIGADLDQFVLFQLTLNIVLALSTFGMHDVLVRDLARLDTTDAVRHKVPLGGLAAVGGLGIVAVAVMSVLAFWWKVDSWLVLGAVSGVCFGQIKLFVAVFRGLSRTGSYLFFQIVLIGVPYWIGIVELIIGASWDLGEVLSTVVAAYVIAALIAWVLAVRILRHVLEDDWFAHPVSQAIGLMVGSRHLYGQSLVAILLQQADVMILAILAPTGSAGVYGVVSRVINAFGIIREAFAFTILQKVAKFVVSRDSTAVAAYTEKSARYFFGPLVVGFVLSVLFAGDLVAFIFGRQSTEGAILFSVLVFTQLGFVLYGSTDHILLAAGLEKLIFKFTLVAAALFLVLSPPMTLAFGSIGLALVVVVQRNLTVALGWKYLRGKGIFVKTLGRIEFEK